MLNTMSDNNEPKVLIVDDDPDVRNLLMQYLSNCDLRVSLAADGTEMLARLEAESIDLILLDLRLAGEDGLSLARRIRDKSAVPIIILSGRTDEADRVMALELAADDYVTKPFSQRELLARIRAVLRRTHETEAATKHGDAPRAYRFSGWELNMRRRRLTAPDGSQVDLTNCEFNLLSGFLSAPQRVLSRDQLLERSRLHSLEVYDRSIDVTILRLRRKIESNPAIPTMLLTKRGVGYVFAASVGVLR